MKYGIIVQARLTGSRFQNKVLSNLDGKPIILWVLERIKLCHIPIVVAIPATKTNDYLETFLKEKGYEVFRGAENDVLDRFYQCAKKYKFNIIIRINADNPLILPGDVLFALGDFIEEKRFIYANHVWVFNFKMLEWAWKNCPEASTRVDVVRAFFNTVDYPEDIGRLENWLQR